MIGEIGTANVSGSLPRLMGNARARIGLSYSTLHEAGLHRMQLRLNAEHQHWQEYWPKKHCAHGWELLQQHLHPGQKNRASPVAARRPIGQLPKRHGRACAASRAPAAATSRNLGKTATKAPVLVLLRIRGHDRAISQT